MANEKFIAAAIVIIGAILLLVTFASPSNKSEPIQKNDIQLPNNNEIKKEENKEIKDMLKAITEMNSNIASMASGQRELAFKMSEIEVRLDKLETAKVKSEKTKETETEKEKEKEPEKEDEVPSLEVEKKNMKSQFGEDRYVYENFFKNPLKKNGFFLEVGALNGVLYSNTFFYENVLGWDGILIEATPKTAEQMKRNRKASYRFHGGVCDQKKNIQILSSGLDAVNGNPETMSEKFIEQFHSEKRPNKQIFDVECNTLTYYINQSGRNYIDFMIVDVEGGEYEALKGFDWDNITVGVWAIEITEPELEKNLKIKDMLTEHGYVYNKRLHLSEIWVNKKLL